ncbi:MAG: flavin reductase family protein [Clostridia bacterium]|nr:flavin reductase family protein [Clostridia bacterium]
MRSNFKPGALTAPLPPVLVTVKSGGVSNIITIGWTGILATNPPKTYISVRPSRHSYEMLKEAREFVINLAPAQLATAVDYCGIYTGAKVDKFEKCSLTQLESQKVAAPTISECPIALECRVTDILPMGTHDVFMADIVSVSCDESIIDKNGKIRYDKADLLAYVHGEYFGLGARLGKFGFSTEKGTDPARRTIKNEPHNKSRKPGGKRSVKR